MTVDRIKNRIEALNSIATYANRIVPLLKHDVNMNGLKFKKGVNELFTKDHERLQAIYKPQNGEKLQVYLSIHGFGDNKKAVIVIRTSYQVTEETVGYCELSYTINNGVEYTPEKLYDVAEMRVKHAQSIIMLEKAHEMEREAKAIQYITIGR